MIGIFDSGIGGLTVVRALMAGIPGYDLVYFGDTARTPYGTKSAETVRGYTLENIDFLLNQGAKMIVMACNTASSVATAQVLAKFKVPIFEVITPAVELALKLSKNLRFGVIGTRATIKSGIYEKSIIRKNPTARVYSAACPLLVPLVEEGWLKTRETAMIVKKYLHPLKDKRIDTLILGCTHYPLLNPCIQTKIGRRVAVVDSSLSIAEKIREFIENHVETAANLTQRGGLRIFVSDVTDQFERLAGMTLKTKVHLEKIRL
jgi:glutamate racemase